MKLHEYQSKFRFADFGIPIPLGKVATTPQDAYTFAKEIDGPVVVKAQVLVGGRGKAGGVKLAQTPDDAQKFAEDILGMNIKGLTVKKVLIDPAAKINNEIYLGVTLDRTAHRTVIMASAAGGVDIEEVAATTPEKIIRVLVNPFLGLRNYQALHIANGIGLPRDNWKQFIQIAKGLYDVYVESDASLAEINPLIITEDGDLLAVDGKMVIDDSALFRHRNIAEMRDLDEEEPLETTARQAGLAYIKLDGNIGCMVNGAGLAMTTMDIIKLYGGEPANFLDTAGGADVEKVEQAFEILLNDPSVEAILVNIFGGITRCDEVAEGILAALAEVEMRLPMVVRLVGTRDREGREILANAQIDNLKTATTLAEAAQMAVEAAKMTK